MATSDIDESSQDIILVAVLGQTGAGKSSFINKATGGSLEVGSTLGPCTQGIQEVKLSLDGHRMVLIDTPGFDDSYRDDAEILNIIGIYLQQGSKERKILTGVIYMQRITDNMMYGLTPGSLLVLRKLCGADRYTNIALVTSQWDLVAPAEGEDRENQLCAKDGRWGEMIRNGTTVHRHSNSKESAIKILRQFLPKPLSVLQLQEELSTVHGNFGSTAARKEIVELLYRKEELISEANATREYLEGKIRRLKAKMDMLKQQNSLNEDLRSKQKLIDEARIAEEKAESDLQDLKKEMEGVQQGKQTNRAIEEDLKSKKKLVAEVKVAKDEVEGGKDGADGEMQDFMAEIGNLNQEMEKQKAKNEDLKLTERLLEAPETPRTVQFAFYEDWRLTFTTSMGVASRNSVSNNLKLRFEGLIAPLRVNWFPFASPEKPLQSDRLRVTASCACGKHKFTLDCEVPTYERHSDRHPSSRETTRTASWIVSTGLRASKERVLGETGNILARNDSVDSDGPSGSGQSKNTALIGSPPSGASLQIPDSAIVREGRTSAYVPGSTVPTSDQHVAKDADYVLTQALQPYVLFCVPTPAVSPHGAYLSHICRKTFTGHDFFTELNAEFNRLRGSTRWGKFWARFRVIGCQEIKLVRFVRSSDTSVLDGDDLERVVCLKGNALPKPPDPPDPSAPDAFAYVPLLSRAKGINISDEDHIRIVEQILTEGFREIRTSFSRDAQCYEQRLRSVTRKCNGYLDRQLDIEGFGICTVLSMDIINVGRLLAVLVLLCCMGAGVWLYFHHTDLQNAFLPLTIITSFAAAGFGYLTLVERTA